MATATRSLGKYVSAVPPADRSSISSRRRYDPDLIIDMSLVVVAPVHSFVFSNFQAIHISNGFVSIFQLEVF
jgi:hypothetical protein